MADTPHSLLDRLRAQPQAKAPEWQRFVALYTPLIQGWLRRQGLLEQDVDDLVQEVLSAVIRELPHFDIRLQRGSFRSWLRTVTVHRLQHFWRTQRARPVATGMLAALQQLEDPHSTLSRLWDQEHDEQVAKRLLELLAHEFEPKTWQAFRRVVVDGQPPTSVAAELGLSVNAVYIARSRVLARVREEGKGLLE